MEDSRNTLKRELDEVESELVCVESELESLLQRKQELLEMKQLLKVQLDSLEDAELQEERTRLEATDWEHGVFPWTEGIESSLRSSFKLNSFRPLQLSCINATLSNKDTILIMPTGGGKSLCYQLPATISEGITLVISPLVSLMEDQLIAVKSLGIESCMLNASSSREEVNRVHTAMTDKRSSLKLLYVTPEKIAKSKRFMSKLEQTYGAGRLSRIVIDEVHCASQWGHDFRPDYKILGILKRQFPNTPILGLTATATAKVLTDCQDMLSLRHCLIFRASYNRSNLFYEVRVKPSSLKAQIEDVVYVIKTKFANECGLVYCFTRKDAEQVCQELCRLGIKAGCYHADFQASERTRVHKEWLDNTIQVIVATVAFGMGIDKPDVRFVIHHSISKSMENYYQESGRAGRDGKLAHCIVFYRAADAFRQSSMVFTEHTGLQSLYTMLKYCLNETECRRAVIARSFGEKWRPEDCQAACDVCKKLSASADEPGSSSQGSFSTVNEDVSEQCKAFVEIIEQAKAKDQNLTGLQLIEACRGKRNSKSQANRTLAHLSTEKCERILVHAILEDVLKEDFHYTPYSTISYMGIGRKAAVVKMGRLTINLKSAQPNGMVTSETPQKTKKPGTPAKLKGAPGTNDGPKTSNSSSAKGKNKRDSSTSNFDAEDAGTSSKGAPGTNDSPKTSNGSPAKGNKLVKSNSSTSRFDANVSGSEEALTRSNSSTSRFDAEDSSVSGSETRIAKHKKRKFPASVADFSDDDFEPTATKKPKNSKQEGDTDDDPIVID